MVPTLTTQLAQSMKIAIRLCIPLIVGLWTCSGLAANRNWISTSDPSWFNGTANWSGGAVPQTNDTPRLGVAASPVPTVWPDYNGDNTSYALTGLFNISQVMDAWYTNTGGIFVSGGNVALGNGNGFTGNWI